MYDGIVGRFTSIDPQGQFFSPYVGMGNNPVSGVDPTGGETVVDDYFIYSDGRIEKFVTTKQKDSFFFTLPDTFLEG